LRTEHENSKLTIQESWCKGCGICVAFCPRSALALRDGKAAVVDEERCVGCGLCVKLCPDFAIYFEEQGVTVR